jgi:hypothetical protein
MPRRPRKSKTKLVKQTDATFYTDKKGKVESYKEVGFYRRGTQIERFFGNFKIFTPLQFSRRVKK